MGNGHISVTDQKWRETKGAMGRGGNVKTAAAASSTPRSSWSDGEAEEKTEEREATDKQRRLQSSGDVQTEGTDKEGQGEYQAGAALK